MSPGSVHRFKDVDKSQSRETTDQTRIRSLNLNSSINDCDIGYICWTRCFISSEYVNISDKNGPRVKDMCQNRRVHKKCIAMGVEYSQVNVIRLADGSQNRPILLVRSNVNTTSIAIPVTH